jgi:hypothetical protein
MNWIVRNAAVSTWRRFKIQHLALICGVTIAAGAAFAIRGSEVNSVPAPASVAARDSISTSLPDVTPRFVLFIAGSQQQADDHAVSLSEHFNPRLLSTYGFVVVTNPEEEERARALGDWASVELANAGTDFRVVDLRGP